MDPRAFLDYLEDDPDLFAYDYRIDDSNTYKENEEVKEQMMIGIK